jgi:hypothetical protein
VSSMRSHSKNRTNRTHITTVIIVLFLLNLFLPISGFAMNDDSRDTLVFLGNENLAPIVYDDNGTAKGVAVDIAKAIGDKIGCDIKVMAVNWEQAQTMVLNGYADGLLQINPGPERNKLYDFSSPLLKSDFSIFVQSGNITLRSIDDLRGKRVGVEAGGYPISLLQGYEGIDIEKIDDWETSFRDLSAGDLDAIIVDRWIGDINQFESHKQLAKFAGLAWTQHQSGNFTASQTRLIHSGNRFLRYYLIEAADSVRMHDPVFARYYELKKAEPKQFAHKRALALTARKLVRLVFSLLKTNQLYQPEGGGNRRIC